MQIIDMLDRVGKELHFWSGSGKRHLIEGELDTTSSSHGSEPAEELC